VSVHRPPSGPGPVPPGAGTLYFCEVSIFFDLFNPNNRHRTEESRRLENTREEEAQGEPGRGPIDLNSGTVLIRPPGKEQAATKDGAAPDGGALEDSAPEDSVREDSAPEDGDAAAPTREDGGA
jgi:hypothetical protein